MTLHAFSLFHLNLNYSAIELSQHKEVINRCYFPLLQLCERRKIPFGIELTGSTLERILELSPEWVELFRRLLNNDRCELIGSGYSQIIAPLVPLELTDKNLQIGNDVYREVLGVTPTIALLNEQSYAGGALKTYSKHGYRAFIMEWENPSLGNNWNEKTGFTPQRIDGADLPVIWNHSISFQKFQRFVHGDIGLDEYLEYIRSQFCDYDKVFSIYGNDVEIFDFRPGRYTTESTLGQDEWQKVDQLYGALQKLGKVRFCKPSETLTFLDETGNKLRLESDSNPVPVKKQPKYNVTRWAVTGRNDFKVNTRCRRIFEVLQNDAARDSEDWKNLCFLWSSDFRTHITETRWKDYQSRLSALEQKLRVPHTHERFQPESVRGRSIRGPRGVKWHVAGKNLLVEGERLRVSFNRNRGMALTSFIDLSLGNAPLWGTLPHGRFPDIRWAADFYSGHLVLEVPGRPKLTDLTRGSERVEQTNSGLDIFTVLETPRGRIEKRWRINDKAGWISLQLKLDWPEAFLGALRLGHMTLEPDAFDVNHLYYEANLGGENPTRIPIRTPAFDHGRPVSFLVSTTQSLGMTDGTFAFGDGIRQAQVKFRPANHALVGLVSHQRFADSHFTRFCLSARELDDTSHPAPMGPIEFELEYSARSMSV